MQNRLIKKDGAGAKYSYKYDKNGNLIKEEGKERETSSSDLSSMERVLNIVISTIRTET